MRDSVIGLADRLIHMQYGDHNSIISSRRGCRVGAAAGGAESADAGRLSESFVRRDGLHGYFPLPGPGFVRPQP